MKKQKNGTQKGEKKFGKRLDKAFFLCYTLIRKGKEIKTMINNLPDYANEYPFIVATGELEDLWFYGAYNTFEKANEVAEQVDGVVIAK